MSNEEIQNRINERRTLLVVILKKEGNWMGHVITGKIMLTSVLKNTEEGERRRGTKKLTTIDYINRGCYKITKELVWDRNNWRK